MAKNYVQLGDTLDLIAVANISSGSIYENNDIVGVALGDALDTEDVRVMVKGVFDLTKDVQANTYAVGALVYNNSGEASQSVTTVVGRCVLASTASDLTVRVKLDPNAS